MINTILRSKLLVLVIIIIVLFGGWYVLTSSSSAPASESALSGTAPDTSGDQSIVATLTALQSITLSGDVFSNPAYVTLKDYTTAIQPEPIGRSDPFAPLAVPAVAAPAAAKAVQIFKAAK